MAVELLIYTYCYLYTYNLAYTLPNSVVARHLRAVHTVV